MRFRLPHGEWNEVAPVAMENVVDWEGCGDTTTAVFLDELGKIGLPPVVELKKEQVRSALETAAEIAAKCTQFYGSKGWVRDENKALNQTHKKVEKNYCRYPEAWDDRKKNRVHIFLAGPILGGGSWQKKLIDRFVGDDRVLFIDPNGPDPNHKVDVKATWECRELNRADIVVFWLPLQATEIRNGHEYGRTTRIEFGEWGTKKARVVFGIDPAFPGGGYFRFRAKAHGIQVNETFDELVAAIRGKVDELHSSENVFHTAATCFGDTSALTELRRPFRHVEEMDGEMIRLWNDHVGPLDTVWHFGSFGDFLRVKELSGKINLVLDENDMAQLASNGIPLAESASYLKSIGFNEVHLPEDINAEKANVATDRHHFIPVIVNSKGK